MASLLLSLLALTLPLTLIVPFAERAAMQPEKKTSDGDALRYPYMEIYALPAPAEAVRVAKLQCWAKILCSVR